MATMAGLRTVVTRHRTHAEAIGVLALAIVVALMLGIRARRALVPAQDELAKVSAASTEISTFRSSFRTSTPEQDIHVAQLADSLGVAVARNDRVSIAQAIAATAEALGLDQVRVRFAAADTAAAPTRPDVSRISIGVADYSVAVECTGALDAVLSLVNQLPASVALQRLTGAQVNGRTRYNIALAVFESANAPGVASAPGGASHD